LYEPVGDKTDQSSADDGTCGHGTHVAAILAGSSLTGKESLGIAYSAKISFMDIARELDDCSTKNNGKCTRKVDMLMPGSVKQLLEGQVKAGAKIVSFSWGSVQSDYDEVSLIAPLLRTISANT